MPTLADAEVLLIKSLGAAIATALAGATLTNTNITLQTTPAYQEAPDAWDDDAYVIFDVNDAQEAAGSDRNRIWQDFLVMITAWAPDAGSPSEMMKAVSEYLTATAGTVATNVAVAGFEVQPIRQTSRTTQTDKVAGENTKFGKVASFEAVVKPA